MFYAGEVKSELPASSRAVGSGVVEASWGLDEHVEAHHEAQGVLGTVVVDDGLGDDEGSTGGQSFVGLADEHLLRVEVPVVDDVAHHDDIGGEEGVEEAAGAGRRCGR